MKFISKKTLTFIKSFFLLSHVLFFFLVSSSYAQLNSLAQMPPQAPTQPTGPFQIQIKDFEGKVNTVTVTPNQTLQEVLLNLISPNDQGCYFTSLIQDETTARHNNVNLNVQQTIQALNLMLNDLVELSLNPVQLAFFLSRIGKLN
jgi:hypothetical protein